MSKFALRTVAAAIIFAPLTVAQADATFPDKLLREPFKSTKAQERLKKELKLSDTLLEQIKQVIEYGYTFNVVDTCPYSTPQECRGLKYVEVRRVIRFAFDPIVSGVVGKVIEKEQSGCSTLKFPNSGLIAVQRLKITFGGQIKARKNFCDDVLGTHNIAEAEGNWRLAIPASVVPPPAIITNPRNEIVDTGSVKFGDPNYSASIDSSSLFGFINLDSFLGGIINDVFLNFDLSPIKWLLKLFGEDTPEEAIDEMVNEFEKVSSLLKDFSFQLSQPTDEYLSLIHTQDFHYLYPFYVDTGNSGFSQRDYVSSKLQWNVVQVATYPYRPGEFNDLFSQPYGMFMTQLALIDSWDEEDRVHVVARGENLWRISEAELGNPRLHNVLATYNDQLVEPSVLQPGQAVSIPPLWKIFALNNHDMMIRRGDTFWKRYLAEGGGKNWGVWLASVKGDVKNPDKIFPGEIVRTLGTGTLPD